MIEIIASVLGGLVGGLFTFLGVKMTIQHEERKYQREKEEQIKANCPRLEIVEYIGEHIYNKEEPSNITMILSKIDKYDVKGTPSFYYDKRIVEPSSWISVNYTLKNIGKTEIDHLYFTSNLVKSISIFNISNGDNIYSYNNKLLNYSVFLDKSIKPQETINIKICYVTDRIIESSINSAPVSIWLVDTNNNWWEQPLFAPYNRIYNSNISSHQKWKDSTDIITAIKCFADPMLW